MYFMSRNPGNAPHLPLSLRSSSLISSMSVVISKSRPPAEILCLPSLAKLHGNRYASVSQFGKIKKKRLSWIEPHPLILTLLKLHQSNALVLSTGEAPLSTLNSSASRPSSRSL